MTLRAWGQQQTRLQAAGAGARDSCSSVLTGSILPASPTKPRPWRATTPTQSPTPRPGGGGKAEVCCAEKAGTSAAPADAPALEAPPPAAAAEPTAAVPSDPSPAITLPTDQPLGAAAAAVQAATADMSTPAGDTRTTPAPVEGQRSSEGGGNKEAPEAKPVIKSPRVSAGALEPAAGAVWLSKSSSASGASAKLPPVRGAAAPTEHSINSSGERPAHRRHASSHRSHEPLHRPC